MESYKHVPLVFTRIPPEEQLRASREFVSRMAARRSVRFISPEPVAFELIENAIRCASLAPSGANQQPWKFVVVKAPEVKRKIREGAEGEKKTKHYYVQESVGIATGFLLAALHMSGLATLTQTPSTMGFLSKILGRPKNERPFVLVPVGLPAPDATVPAIPKKPLAEVLEIE